MKRYFTSLKSWRSKQTKSLDENLTLYLNIFKDVLNACLFLTENKVNHYDIKCDNFLIDPKLPGTPGIKIYNQETDTPNFSVCLADFGESLVYTDPIEGYVTLHPRGTDFIKSPEMMQVGSYKADEDRRKKVCNL